MTIAFALRVLLQALYFIVVARSLGVVGFGGLAAGVALVSLLAPFASWGSGNVLVMDVAREPKSFPVAFGNALVAIAVSGLALLLVVLLIGATVLSQVPLVAILLLGVAELGFSRLVDVTGNCFQAFDRLVAMASISLLVPCFRFVFGLGLATTSASGSLIAWSGFYLASTVLAAAVGLLAVIRALGWPTPVPALLRRRFRLGGYFAVSASASTIYSDVDKVMLARLVSLDATGIYAPAHRAASLAFMPIFALLTATYPRFFRAGRDGIGGSTDYALRLLSPAVLYGLFAGIALFLIAPLAPVVLGEDYGDTVIALRWLAAMPLLVALCYLPADALTGANAQGVRTVLQVGAVFFNITLNALLIPDHSWRGSAWAALSTLAVLAVSLWVAVILLRRRSRIAQIAQLGEV